MATYKTTSLRTFYDTMEKHLRCLQSLGEDDNNTNFDSITVKTSSQCFIATGKNKRKNR